MAGIIDDLNEINTSLEELKASKQRIRLAIESKLNTNIDPKVPINTYDDYIYKIKSEQEKVKLLLDLSDTNLFSDDGINTHPIIVDANGEPVDIDILHTGEVQQEYEDSGNPYSVAKYIKIEAPEGLIPGNIANNVDIFGIKGTGGWDPHNPTTAIDKYVIATTDPGEIDPSTGEPYPEPIENTFLLPSGERSTGTVANKTGVTNLTGTLTAPAIFNYSYVSSIGIKPNERYLVNNNSEFNIPLAGNNGVVGKVNSQLSLEDKYKILPENIKVGCNIFGVVGTYTTEESMPIRSKDVRAGRIGYVNGEKITGTLSEREARDLIIDYDTPEHTSTITVPVGIYGSLNVRYLRDAEATLTVNGPIITSSNPNNIYAAGGKTLTYNIVSECTESGVIRQGAMNTSTLTITPRDVIPQEPFNENPLAASAHVLQGNVYADRNGNVIEGTMPWQGISSQPISWSSVRFNNDGLIASPSNNAQAGYYNQLSNVSIDYLKLINQYNKHVNYNQDISEIGTPTDPLISSNIPLGKNIFGIEGTFTGRYQTRTLTINNLDLSIVNPGESQPFTPSAPYEVWNQVNILRSTSHISNNIRDGVTIYGVEGNFTRDANITTYSTAGSTNLSSPHILNGYFAYAKGQRAVGTMINNGSNKIYYINTPNEIFELNGYYNKSSVRINDANISNIIPENISSGVTIFGVRGIFEGGSVITTEKDPSVTDGDTISIQPLLKYDQYKTSFVYNPECDPKTRNRFCWVTLGYNQPLSNWANNSTYIVPVNASVEFNIIPQFNIKDQGDSLVRVILLERNPNTQEYEERNDTASGTAQGSYTYLYLSENDEIKESINIPGTAKEVYGLILKAGTISKTTQVWDSGAYKYIRDFGGYPGSVEYLFDTFTYTPDGGDSITYNRYTIKIKYRTGIEADVSGTTATPKTVYKGEDFVLSDGNPSIGQLEAIYDLSFNLKSLPSSYCICDGGITPIEGEEYPTSGDFTGDYKYLKSENNSIELECSRLNNTCIGWKIIKYGEAQEIYSHNFDDSRVPDSDTYNISPSIIDGDYVISGNTQPGGYYIVTLKKKIDSQLGTKTITANGTYTASTDDLLGYSSVTVNVPEPPIWNINACKLINNAYSSPDLKQWVSFGDNTYTQENQIFSVPRDTQIPVIFYTYYDELSNGQILLDGDTVGDEGNWEWYPDCDFTVEFTHPGSTYNIVIERYNPDVSETQSGVLTIN